ncbi:MAG: acyl-CoA dehydratase activase, partial [Chloroflexota bacterium]
MDYYLGLDVGSVNVKLCVIDETGKVVKLDVEKIVSNPQSAVNSVISRLDKAEQIIGAGVSGSGKSVIPAEFGWGDYSSAPAIASGLLSNYPDVKTIIQIGGQSSFVITLEDGLKKPWKVVSNPLCAAGTGRFLEQQAYRLGISMDDFTRLALQCQGTAPRIAARCSVFAKSDLIHLQQKGVQMPDMLYALCESIARMVASLKRGIFEEPVYFVGGLAANGAIVRALNEVLTARNGHEVKVIVPDNFLYIEALGAALLSRGKHSQVRLLPPTSVHQRHFETPRLEAVPVPKGKIGLVTDKTCSGYLGVDIGSTSTKAVILDESGKDIIAKSYLMTAGKPINAIKQVFKNLLRDAPNVTITGVGVTGSGRYLVGGFIGADLIKNEITAQTRAAAEIDPEADIIEIGGQDSKLVIKRNGVVVDYQMNKACAAGTGSFIDELADMLGVRVTNGDFARLAFTAPHTIDLGTRCAAFMGQSVASAQQEGVPLEIITASLANSIAKNYLSKVVGNRKLGNKVILTGAVFYNEAIVSAFHDQLKGKALTVAEHREVSGAVGAALLAKETINGQKSRFKGFRQLIDSDCNLSTFVCKKCDNNCTITQMKLPDEKPTFYGSRCDLFDSTLTQARKETFFDEREKLLLKEYKEGSGTGPAVGIPRALLTYDFAPLLIGFLNALDVRVILSGKTTREVMEQSIELAYTDSCFPLKLVHGHVAALKGKADFILYPCGIRLGVKEGDEDQKYSCPLVQASPFIVRQVLDLGDRFLSPVLDFSLGDAEVVKNLADAAVRMGFSRGQGKQAALAGIASQRSFEAERSALGAKLLEQLRQSDQLGVVLLSRSYMSQDSGANLGIAEKLAQLGMVPIPVDFLPLDTVNPKEYSDRPYWSYESKFIAASDIVARDPKLYGLALTNFGCGPNSFILKLMEDIMGGKPLGQLEIDEHAAEAGIVTRLEAFVDTIKGYSGTARQHPVSAQYIRRSTTPLVTNNKALVILHMSPFVEAIGAALEAYGGRVIMLPESDERSIFYSNQVTSGTECLPYRLTLGDSLKFLHENPDRVKDVEILMAGSYGPCRLGKYALEQSRVLKEAGFDVPMLTTVSNNAYGDIIGPEFQRVVMRGIFAIDCLEKLLWRTRPYEKERGLADKLFDEYLKRITDRIRNKKDLSDVLEQASTAFRSAIDPSLPRRPRVGINGEIYLRSNRFSNNNLVKVCETAGLEVIVSPVGEWIKYISYRYLEDTIRFRRARKLLSSYIKYRIVDNEERRVTKRIDGMLDGGEPSIKEILSKTSQYLSPRCGSEAVLSIGVGVEWLENPGFAGVISVMPHGCMPGGIVAAMAEKLSQDHHKPWISLTYDGILETNNLTRINNFA